MSDTPKEKVIHKFSKKINCHTCKHGYFKGISGNSFHNLCGADNCYLCAMNFGECEDYEEGEIPEGVSEMGV